MGNNDYPECGREKDVDLKKENTLFEIQYPEQVFKDVRFGMVSSGVELWHKIE